MSSGIQAGGSGAFGCTGIVSSSSQINGVDTSAATAPSAGKQLQYDGAKWVWNTVTPSASGSTVWVNTAAVTVANTVTETSLKSGTGSGSVNITPVLGRSCIIDFAGTFATTATPTGAFKIYKNNALLFTTGARSMPGNQATADWHGRLIMSFRSTSTVACVGLVFMAIAATGSYNTGSCKMFLMNAQSGTQPESCSSASDAVDIRFTWGTANASNTMSCTFLKMSFE